MNDLDEITKKIDKLIKYIDEIETELDQLRNGVSQSYNTNFFDRVKYQIFKRCKDKK